MLTSSRSKVQGPTSEVEPPSNVQGKDPDLRPWALDVGLNVSDLRKSFSSPSGERVDVLHGISFSVSAGETVAIMGASGAGKSTLLHLIGGLEAADHGSIALGHFEIESARGAALASFRNNQVGFIFQFHHLLPDLSAAENVALPLVIARGNHRQAMSQAAQSLENIGLGARIAHPAGHLSGGERQRVAACRALITRPSLVLADEPTGNLDASLAEEIGETLVSYAHIRRAIVIVATHNERLAQLCDRILVLRDGRVWHSSPASCPGLK